MSGVKRGGKHQLVVALDLANAFNSAWLPYISEQLERCQVGKSLAGACIAFLKECEISSGAVLRAMEKGCPQGSSLGSTLWNLVMEGWFSALRRADEEWRREKANRKEVDIGYVRGLMIAQAYADDQLVVIPGSSVKEIEAKWKRVGEREHNSNCTQV